jgi:hypothetical protein
MITRLKALLFPPDAARQEITMKGCRLALMQGYRVKSSIELGLLSAHIPECRSYTVEYRLSETGEFMAALDHRGKIAVRSNLGPRHPFPVCWLPRSFAGKRVDRYIVRIDRKRVSYRAGMGYRRAA